MPGHVTPDDLAALVAARHQFGTVLVVGLTGSVAAGKSILAGQVAAALAGELRVEVVSTDAWLLPNAVLGARGLTMRKGFPESYDAAGLAALPAALRAGPVTVAGYSHRTYDVDPALARTTGPADIVIIEGLGFADSDQTARGIADAVDFLVYLDADEDDLAHWFIERFMGFWHAAADDPDSFYARFRAMEAPAARGFAGMIWQTINLANLREHIISVRPRADIVVLKHRDHRLSYAAGTTNP